MYIPPPRVRWAIKGGMSDNIGRLMCEVQQGPRGVENGALPSEKVVSIVPGFSNHGIPNLN